MSWRVITLPGTYVHRRISDHRDGPNLCFLVSDMNRKRKKKKLALVTEYPYYRVVLFPQYSVQSSERSEIGRSSCVFVFIFNSRPSSKNSFLSIDAASCPSVAGLGGVGGRCWHFSRE